MRPHLRRSRTGGTDSGLSNLPTRPDTANDLGGTAVTLRVLRIAVRTLFDRRTYRVGLFFLLLAPLLSVWFARASAAEREAPEPSPFSYTLQ